LEKVAAMALQRPEIVLGFAFGGRIRAAFEERFEVLGVVERPDPALVTPAMAARARGQPPDWRRVHGGAIEALDHLLLRNRL
jgi:hypothetical protein